MKRAERIKEIVPISKVLTHFGYMVDDSDPEREQVFSCDLHGDGIDSATSAKMYSQSSSNAFYCWGCGRVRDSIALVREKQNLSFADSITFLEKLFGLPNLPWEDADKPEKPKTESTLLEGVLDLQEPVSNTLSRVSRFLHGVYQENSLPASRCSAYWETHDKLLYMLEKNLVPEDKIKQASAVLLETLKKELNIGPA